MENFTENNNRKIIIQKDTHWQRENRLSTHVILVGE
jgi:hypothetical protein